MNIKLSQFTLEETTRIRRTTITIKGRTIIIKDKISSENILPTFNATLVMKMHTTPEIVLGTRTPSMRRRKYIMLTPLKMMNKQNERFIRQ